MFAKVSIIAACLLVTASAKPHVFAPLGPAYVTAQSSQVFAQTHNRVVPFAVAAPVPAHYPVPFPATLPAQNIPAFYYPAPVQTVFTYPVFGPAPAVPATPAVVSTPAVVAAAPLAKVVAAAPVAKLVAPVRTAAPYLTTIRYRSVVG